MNGNGLEETFDITNIMRPIFIKGVFRAIATLLALFGLSMSIFGVFISFEFIISGRWGGGVFAILEVVIGAYLVYVGYLAWFRWTPLAIRHVLGILAFYLFSKLPNVGKIVSPADAPHLSGVLTLIGLLLICAVYSWTATYFCKRLFPIDSTGTGILSNAQTANF